MVTTIITTATNSTSQTHLRAAGLSPLSISSTKGGLLLSRAATGVQHYRRELLVQPGKLALVLLALALVFVPSGAWAAIDTTKITAGSKAVISGIQSVCLIALPVLFVSGFGTLTFSGINENFKRVAIRIIGFAFVGAIGLFLFAQPLADLVIGAVGTGA